MDDATIEICIDVAEDEALIEGFEGAELREELAALRRKAAAWAALYGMVDAAQEMGHPLGVTRDLMADLMGRLREEADHA